MQSLTLLYELTASGKASAKKMDVAPAIVISPPPIKKMRSFEEELHQPVLLQPKLRRDSVEDSKSAFSNNLAYFEAMKHSNTRSNGFATNKSQWSNPVKTPDAQQPNNQSAGQSLHEGVSFKSDSTDRKESSNPVVPSSHSLLAPQDLVKKLPSTEVKKLNGIYQLLQKNDHKYGHASFSSGGQVAQPVKMPVFQVEKSPVGSGGEQGPVHLPVNLIKRKGAELSS
jgi:hypothetical protein